VSALPIADGRELAAYARRVVRAHPAEFTVLITLQGLAAAVGLVVPWLLGNMVAAVTDGHDTVPGTTALICGCLLAQAVLIRFGRQAAAVFGEKVLAELRERFVSDVLALPAEIVEDADTGDLLTRTGRDVDVLSDTVRLGIPSVLTSLAIIGFTLVALVLVSPILVLPCLVSVPGLCLVTRWYLGRAHAGYLRQAATYSELTEGLSETVEGARTVDALRLAARRMDQVNHDIGTSYRAARHTLRLRNVFLPICDISYAAPTAAMLLIGGELYLHGVVSLAAITAATLYAFQLDTPVDQLLMWLNEFQTAGASLARLLGVERFTAPAPQPATAEPAPPQPSGRDITITDLHYAYRPGHDVLRGIDLTIRGGEWLAVVGPSGAGKSTLAKLLAGLYQPSHGSVSIGGREVSALAPDNRRSRVALVTQEHHVFRGTLRDNLAIGNPSATDEQMQAALTAVGAGDWAVSLDAATGPGGGGRPALDPAQVQQLALARLILANPDTLILDEATSLLSPGAARHLERSLAAVVRGRTVVAIVHRLHTALDADRIAVIEDGAVTELGTHDELLAAGGSYASLWHAWQGAVTAAPRPDCELVLAAEVHRNQAAVPDRNGDKA
jgi:ABC-type multidrug transport system fused ATPase/permease subunit